MGRLAQPARSPAGAPLLRQPSPRARTARRPQGQLVDRFGGRTHGGNLPLSIPLPGHGKAPPPLFMWARRTSAVGGRWTKGRLSVADATRWPVHGCMLSCPSRAEEGSEAARAAVMEAYHKSSIPGGISQKVAHWKWPTPCGWVARSTDSRR